MMKPLVTLFTTTVKNAQNEMAHQSVGTSTLGESTTKDHVLITIQSTEAQSYIRK